MVTGQDTSLVNQCLEGKPEAYEELVSRHQKSIFNLALRMTGSREDAEDITQTVFVKAYEKLRMFNHRYKFFSWIYRIGMNETLNHLKRRQRVDALNEDTVSSGPEPDDEYARNELNQRVQQALLALPPETRTLIVMKHFEDLSYAEMATLLDITDKKVKSRLYSARQALKEVLQKDGFLENE